jgi:hypothetical protein
MAIVMIILFVQKFFLYFSTSAINMRLLEW